MLMSEAKGRNNKPPDSKGSEPTRSFNSTVLGPGSQVGPFRIEQEIGRGAMRVIYLAHDTKLDHSVAIKSLPVEVMSNPVVRKRRKEARILDGNDTRSKLVRGSEEPLYREKIDDAFRRFLIEVSYERITY
jgi:serine/threonine protein kinase